MSISYWPIGGVTAWKSFSTFSFPDISKPHWPVVYYLAVICARLECFRFFDSMNFSEFADHCISAFFSSPFALKWTRQMYASIAHEFERILTAKIADDMCKDLISVWISTPCPC